MSGWKINVDLGVILCYLLNLHLSLVRTFLIGWKALEFHEKGNQTLTEGTCVLQQPGAVGLSIDIYRAGSGDLSGSPI